MDVSEEQVKEYWTIMVNNQPEDVVKILTGLTGGTVVYKEFVANTIEDVYDSFREDFFDDEE